MKEKRNGMTSLKRVVKDFFSRGPVMVVSVIIILVFVVLAIFAPLIAKDPNAIDLLLRFKKPNGEHLLGTDALGRDILSRIIYGSRISLLASLGSGVVACIIGITLGLIAGYYEGIFGGLIMRLVDVQMSIPPLLFSMIVLVILGDSVPTTILAVGIGMVPTYIRMVHGMVLSLKGNDYITAVDVIGQSDFKILFKHLLPNCYPSIIVLFTMNLGQAILTESGLSFIGLGIVAPNVSWGSMISEGFPYLTRVPLLCIMPGICVALVVIALNFIGDGLRDALDPRLRGKI